jgi:23S rRNA (adenine2503-C2)-methyltransferase
VSGKVDLRNMTRGRITELFKVWNLPPGRAEHLFSWLYKLGSYDLAQVGTLNKEIKQVLVEKAFISKLVLCEIEKSKDGTLKFGFKLSDGELIESVLIPGSSRQTLCVSSQVGCAMGCRFCLTGGMGFVRNLRPAEIVNQVVAVMEYLVNESGGARLKIRELINNLVFMGMGEPLANYDNLISALKILMDQKGFEFTERRVTVSTCGIVPRIKDLGNDVRVNLAVSLHAADDNTRSSLMPINQKYCLSDLLMACRDFPLSKKKVILFEYILLKGINDSQKDAEALAEKLAGIACRINLMPYNESADLPYKCPDEECVKYFCEILRKAGYTTIVRDSRGGDISAACGQLSAPRK